MSTSRVACGLFILVAAVMPLYAEDMQWGCYDPKPGHPAASERYAFLDRLRPVAVEVEKEYGTPRSGILAMAVQESGYGWTRTAIYAENVFGWKFGQSARQAGLSSWTLQCQPRSDPGKDYAVFGSFEDSMRFVADQLSRRGYASATAQAKKAKENGESEHARTADWLRAIQRAGYNPNPHYPDDVMKAGREAGVFSGWSNSSTGKQSESPVKTASSEDVQEVLKWMRKGLQGRYMVTGAKCSPEALLNWPDYQNLPKDTLQKCTYTVTSCADAKSKRERATCEAHRTFAGAKSATAVLLEPGLERFATWIASACAEVGGDRGKCLRTVYEDGRSQGNWQIPVAGIVYEDMQYFVQRGYAFRDGLTVKADAQCGWINADEAPPSPQQNIDCGRPGAVPLGVSNKARPMSSATGRELIAWDPKYSTRVPKHPEEYPITGVDAESWRRFVRDTLVTACSSENNPFVSARAFALRQAGKF